MNGMSPITSAGLALRLTQRVVGHVATETEGCSHVPAAMPSEPPRVSSDPAAAAAREAGA
jgi:hypothetical protein